jgi:hypothetical protein
MVSTSHDGDHSSGNRRTLARAADPTARRGSTGTCTPRRRRTRPTPPSRACRRGGHPARSAKTSRTGTQRPRRSSRADCRVDSTMYTSQPRQRPQRTDSCRSPRSTDPPGSGRSRPPTPSAPQPRGAASRCAGSTPESKPMLSSRHLLARRLAATQATSLGKAKEAQPTARSARPNQCARPTLGQELVFRDRPERRGRRSAP